MRALFVTGRSDLPERHLIAGLSERGWEALVIGDLDGEIESFFRSRGVTTERLAIRSRLDLAAVLRLRRSARAWRPAVVQCFTSRGLTCAILAGLPRGAKLVGYRGAVGGVSRWDPSALFGILHPRVDAVLCVSRSIANTLAARGVHPHKLHAIYKGHDPLWYRQEENLHRPPGLFIAGFIGNMRPVKGAHVLLEALRLLPAESKTRVVLIGDVLDRNVKRLLRDPLVAQKVECRGFVAKASRLIPSFDLLVVPSLEGEGLSKAALEAMAQGVPVLASASGGLAEIIEDGVSGRLVPPGDPGALASALRELECDAAARRRYAEEAFRRIENELNIRRTISEVDALYRSLASPR